MLARRALRLVRLFGSGAHKSTHASGHHHDSHSHDSSSHDSHSHDSSSHDSHHSHNVPEGSWHRHSDDVDPYYWYNKYGPFHIYTHLNHCRPGDNHNIPEEDPYRNEIQGYLTIADPNDDRISTNRGYMEYLVGFAVLVTVLGVATRRHFMETDFTEKRIGDALVVSQEIEDFVKEVKEVKKRQQ